jgi:hypothetical protein
LFECPGRPPIGALRMNDDYADIGIIVIMPTLGLCRLGRFLGQCGYHRSGFPTFPHLPTRHNPDVLFSVALWPGKEDICWSCSSSARQH